MSAPPFPAGVVCLAPGGRRRDPRAGRTAEAGPGEAGSFGVHLPAPWTQGNLRSVLGE